MMYYDAILCFHPILLSDMLVVEEKWSKRCGPMGEVLSDVPSIFFLCHISSNLCMEPTTLLGALRSGGYFLYEHAKSDEWEAWLEKQMMELKMGYGLCKDGPSIMCILPPVVPESSIWPYVASSGPMNPA